MPGHLISIEQAAVESGYSARSVFAAITRGELPAYRQNGRTLVELEAVREWAAPKPKTPPAPGGQAPTRAEELAAERLASLREEVRAEVKREFATTAFSSLFKELVLDDEEARLFDGGDQFFRRVAFDRAKTIEKYSGRPFEEALLFVTHAQLPEGAQ